MQTWWRRGALCSRVFILQLCVSKLNKVQQFSIKWPIQNPWLYFPYFQSGNTAAKPGHLANCPRWISWSLQERGIKLWVTIAYSYKRRHQTGGVLCHRSEDSFHTMIFPVATSKLKITCNWMNALGFVAVLFAVAVSPCLSRDIIDTTL